MHTSYLPTGQRSRLKKVIQMQISSDINPRRRRDNQFFLSCLQGQRVRLYSLPAVNYLEMHYRSLELCKTQTLSGSLDYDKTLSLSSQARSDLQWVI